MGIPGSNILNKAMKVIASQTVTYHKFLRRVDNGAGLDIAQYAAAVPLRGSWQPVPRRLYQTLGLEWNSIYITFYVSKEILDVQRDVSGDQISYCGKRYNCLSATDWTQVDGWTGVLLVQIGDDNG